MVNPKQILHFNDGNGHEEHIPFDEFNFHPILKDIENIFWLWMLSAKALGLAEIQKTLKNDEVFSCILNKYNKWTNLGVNFKENGREYTTTSNHQDQMIFVGKAMVILAFDFLSSSKYQNSIRCTKEFQFLRHLRNGAAHYNTFNLKDEDGNWKIGKNESVEWKNKKIDRSLQGKKVFPGFFQMFEAFFLVYDISNMLDKIDKKVIIK